jgi:hypothetical protein
MLSETARSPQRWLGAESITNRNHVEVRGLMSYGASLGDAYRQRSAARINRPAGAARSGRDRHARQHTSRTRSQSCHHELFTQEFTKALTVADRAHALLPDDLAIEGNRAHALMFLGRGEDCKALYLAYKGKLVSGPLRERAIPEDFAEFRKAGLTHPMMADIEKELGVSP